MRKFIAVSLVLLMVPMGVRAGDKVVVENDKISVKAKGQTITITDVQTQKALMTLAGHKDDITALALTPDGKLLVSGSADKTVRVWVLASGELRLSMVGPKPVQALEVTKDGKQIIAKHKDGSARIYDLDTGEGKDVDAPKKDDK